MKILKLIIFVTFIFLSRGISQCATDSLSLVSLYNSTNGSLWTDNTGWLTTTSYCDWYGITCDANGCVTEILFEANNLTGKTPIEIGNFSELQILFLQNNSIADTIPSSIGNLSKLRQLWLSNNQLVGTIPKEIGSITNLFRLHLFANQLVGDIPIEIGNLSALDELGFGRNQLTGTIPLELNNLVAIRNLNLGDNNLGGFIPFDFGNFPLLRSLNLRDNSLTGTIPSSIGDPPIIRFISLERNSLSGSIPSSLYSLSTLEGIRLESNNLSGTISPLIQNLSVLKQLYLNDNMFTGNIPDGIGDLPITGLGLSNNQFVGCFPSDFNNFCGEGWATNFNLSDGNNFNSTYDDFCNCNAGICACNDINEWLGGTGSWDDETRWSLTHVPLACEIVEITGAADMVTIPNNYESVIYLIEVKGGAALEIPSSANLQVLADPGFSNWTSCN